MFYGKFTETIVYCHKLICKKALFYLSISLTSMQALASHFHTIALGKTKIVCSFGLSECSSVKV